MKRTDFIRMLERNGWWLERDKGNHQAQRAEINKTSAIIPKGARVL